MNTMATNEFKKCSKCGEVKSLGEFYKDSSRPDGHSFWCRPCKCAQVKSWRELNYTKHIENTKKWAMKNPEKRLAMARDRYTKDPSKALNRTRQRTIQLADSYVSNTMGCKVSEVPPALIALKREQLAIKRMARELKKAATQQDGATP